MSLEEDPTASQWSPLKCKNTPDGVQLYYDFSNSATGLSVAVTDLCSIWDTSLSREGVERTAREQNCSIDPAESTTQLRTLLNKLKQSLLEGRNDIGHNEYHFDGVMHFQLSLRTSLKLPAPLKMLQWTFYLPQRGNAVLARSVTFPLLREATLMKRQMETLYQVIKEKDHVLSKLLDKIENSAIDLSLIFPGITGMKSRRQRIDVTEASKHVPGMATFDRSAWEAGIARSHGDIRTGNMGLSNILDCSKICTVPAIPSVDWIQKAPMLDENTKSLACSGAETNDDAHETAPLQRNQSVEAKIDDSGSATDSDFEDLVDTPRKRVRNTEQGNDPGSSPSPRGPQKIRLLSSSPIPTDELRRAPRKHNVSDSSSGDESENTIKHAATASTKLAGKIGMLGGKRKASPAPRSSPSAPVSLNVPTPSRKLGVLGGQRAPVKSPSKSPVPLRTQSKTSEAPDNGADSDTASSISSAPVTQECPSKPLATVATPPSVREESPGVEESVEEKAKRKREELRSQAQTNAMHAKKKVRRF